MKTIKFICKVLCIIFALPMTISIMTLSAEPFVYFCRFGAETIVRCIAIACYLLGIGIATAAVALAAYAVWYVLTKKSNA